KYLILMLCLTTSVTFPTKKICLISAPRSLSVAFLRMIEARGDFQILHEPSQYVFNLKHSPIEVQKWFNLGAPKTYEQVKDLIINTSQEGNVFIKEISFAVYDWLTKDIEWIRNPDMYFVFLLRDPHHIALSFYKKLEPVFDGTKHQFENLIGYQSLYEIYQVVKQHAKHKPYIILTEDLYTNPEKTIDQFCKAMDIPFMPECMHWDNLGADFNGKEWNEIKHHDITYHWHGDALKSTGFGKPTMYARDADGKPTFEEIKNEEHRIAAIKAYEANLPYYHQLLAQISKEV
ncbi:MAG TPA: hypothetical protein VFF04_06090, partial [Candidatus Babeliales bacterium]|nr:hypothetical protein [Candidatus Babeliales bacterium]